MKNFHDFDAVQVRQVCGVGVGVLIVHPSDLRAHSSLKCAKFEILPEGALGDDTEDRILSQIIS
jgi:hypothetical protein